MNRKASLIAAILTLLFSSGAIVFIAYRIFCDTNVAAGTTVGRIVCIVSMIVVGATSIKTILYCMRKPKHKPQSVFTETEQKERVETMRDRLTAYVKASPLRRDFDANKSMFLKTLEKKLSSKAAKGETSYYLSTEKVCELLKETTGTDYSEYTVHKRLMYDIDVYLKQQKIHTYRATAGDISISW